MPNLWIKLYHTYKCTGKYIVYIEFSTIHGFRHLLEEGILFFFFNFYLILLYNTVLVFPYIDMNPPRVYMRSQTWTPLPPGGGDFRTITSSWMWGQELLKAQVLSVKSIPPAFNKQGCFKTGKQKVAQTRCLPGLFSRNLKSAVSSSNWAS